MWSDAPRRAGSRATPAPPPRIAERAVAADDAGPRAAGRGSVVLVVGGLPANRKLLLLQLETLRVTASAAENTLEALVLWRQGAIGLVITDCHMPAPDGYALARAIRDEEARARAPRTPVVGWTAHNLLEEAGRCAAAGMDDLLPKPASLPALLAVLERWLPAQGAARAPAPRADDATPFLDPAARAGRTDDPDERRRMITDYLAQVGTSVATLRQALEALDLSAIAGAAQRIKGGSEGVGALEVAAVSELLEAAASRGDRGAIAAEHDPLVEALRRLEDYVSGSRR